MMQKNTTYEMKKIIKQLFCNHVWVKIEVIRDKKICECEKCEKRKIKSIYEIH